MKLIIKFTLILIFISCSKEQIKTGCPEKIDFDFSYIESIEGKPHFTISILSPNTEIMSYKVDFSVWDEKENTFCIYSTAIDFELLPFNWSRDARHERKNFDHVLQPGDSLRIDVFVFCVGMVESDTIFITNK